MTMTNNLDSHARLRELLPWYVNETLKESEYDLVATHLINCPVCQEDVAILKAAQSALASNDVEAIVPVKTADQLLHGSDVRSAQRQGYTRHWLPLLAAAASIVAIVFFLQSGEPPGSNENQVFETATSGSGAAHIDYVLHVEFVDGLAIEQRQGIVEGLAGVSSWSVDDSNRYIVQLQVNDPTLARLEEFERQVRSIDGVELARFVAMQVPVR